MHSFILSCMQVTAELCANSDTKNGDGTALAFKDPPCSTRRGLCRSTVEGERKGSGLLGKLRLRAGDLG